MQAYSLEERQEFARSGIVPTTVGGGVADRAIAVRREYRSLGLYDAYCAANGAVRLADIDLEVMVEAIAAYKARAAAMAEATSIEFVEARPVEADGGLRLQVSDPTPAPAVEKVAPVVAKLPQFLDEDDASLAAPAVEPAIVVEPEPVRVPVAVRGVTTGVIGGKPAGKYADATPTPRFVEPPRQVGTIVSVPTTPWTPPAPRAKPAPKRTQPQTPFQASAENGSFGTFRDLFPAR